ncbi:MAG: hypothetical protein R3B45_07240 [Bdellovibrionota bacterium]
MYQYDHDIKTWLYAITFIASWGLLLFLSNFLLCKFRLWRKLTGQIHPGDKKHIEKTSDIKTSATSPMQRGLDLAFAGPAIESLKDNIVLEPIVDTNVGRKAFEKHRIDKEAELKTPKANHVDPIQVPEKTPLNKTIKISPSIIRLRETFETLPMGEALQKLALLTEQERHEVMSSLELNPAIRQQLNEHILKQSRFVDKTENTLI